MSDYPNTHDADSLRRQDLDAPEDVMSPADAAALDALAGAGYDADAVPPEHRERAARIASLLGLIDAPAPDLGRSAGVLVDAVMARVDRASRVEPTLSYRDDSALEAWVMSGYDPARVPGSLRDRAAKLEAMRRLVVSGPVVSGPVAGEDGGSADLVERTLGRVQHEIDDQASRMTIERARRGVGVRLADLASVAAVLLIGSAIIWPMASAMRHQSRLDACAANMQAAGMGFNLYARDHREALPVTTSGEPGRPWWNTGTPEESNSANLYGLVSDGYATLHGLACPGNPEAVTELEPGARDWPTHQSLSYSYRIMVGGQPAQAHWGQQQRSVVIADRSPIIAFSMRGEPFVPETNSLQHGGHGQQALMSDGSSVWLEVPVFDGDNIWLPAGIEQAIRIMRSRGKAAPLSGTETPANAADDFVGP